MSEHSEFYDLDDVRYEIRVEKDRTGYFGRWDCFECGRTGGSSGTSKTIEEAVIAAQVNIAPHQAMKHSKKKRDSSRHD